MKIVVLKKKTFYKIVCLLVGVVLLSVFFGTASVTAMAKKQVPIYSVDTDKKQIAISFDCAWGVDYTDKLLSIMQEKGVKCTFFCVEFWVKKHPDYVKKIFDFGHEIGTHSATHPYMSKLGEENIIKELTTSTKAIEDITGQKVNCFRPPYGDYNDRLINTCKSLSLYPIQWSVDSLDWKDLSAKQIYDRVISKATNGSIVLFHNQGLHTHEAIADIIDTLQNKGYEFKTVYELIYKDNYIIDGTGKQISQNKSLGKT